jgi:hypothetical protein
MRFTEIIAESSGTRLKDIAKIATNMQDADFWLIRKGSDKTVGRPVKEFDPSRIGIKVVRTDVLDPKYLYYVMMNLHNQGQFARIANGTTNLVNITVNDIANIPLGQQDVAEATGDPKFDTMMNRMTTEPKYPDKKVLPTSIPELIQWAEKNNKPDHWHFAQWANKNKFTNVNDALAWFGDNVDPTNEWGPKDPDSPWDGEWLEDAAKHDPKAAELLRIYNCYERIVFDWSDDYRQMNMPDPFKDKDLEESLNEFAPSNGDDREPDEEEILKRLAAQWWLGTEQQMAKAQKTLAAMGWDIGQDESGDDDAGVFLIRAGDDNGDSYIAFNHSDLELNEGETWSKHNNPRAGGMSKKSVSSYRRSHPGSKIQTAVTTKPSKIKKGSKDAKRRKSFCARMKGMKKSRTSAKTARDPNSNINKSLRRWNCESIEQMEELVIIAEQMVAKARKEIL